MLKRILIILGLLSIHTICGHEGSNIQKAASDEPKLDDEPYGVAEAIETAKELVEGQRQKRFYDYSYIGYNTGSSAFSSVIPTYPNYASSDPYHSTNVPNEQKRLSEIIRRLEHIAYLTRGLHVPASHRIPQIPFFIPFHTFSQECTCPPTNANPPTKLPDAPTTQQPPATYLPPETKAPEKGTTKMPDFGNRSGEGDTTTKPNVSDDDYDDGVRQISFDPIPPKGPQSVVAPPVEHGSFQAGLDPEPPGSSGRPEESVGISTQFDETPLSAPTVCDGAILTCCHRQEVTYDCFAREGCGELEYEKPCDPKVLLSIVNKFRTHFKARG